MVFTNGAQKVEVFPAKRAIKSGAVGSTNVAEVKWLIETLAKHSAAWKLSGWAYLCDISQMQPATPEVCKELVGLHKLLATSGCKAMAFIEGASSFTAAQAKEHQKQSKAAIQEGHFRTEAEALKWVETIVK
ncbi:MAG: hypothetical protein J6A76_05250 [Oscillospiraceae bacterium]|nr:hypothetical protein [Oscillospiraceae bacterium]